jgi:hypothetical protein
MHARTRVRTECTRREVADARVLWPQIIAVKNRQMRQVQGQLSATQAAAGRRA